MAAFCNVKAFNRTSGFTVGAKLSRSVQFNFIYTATVTVKVVSRRLSETQTPNEKRGGKKLPFNRKKLQPGRCGGGGGGGGGALSSC